MVDTLTQLQYFSSHVYKIEKPEFLDAVKQIANKELWKLKVTDKMDPVIQTSTLNDPTLDDFGSYIAQTSWNIFNEQGYAMNNYNTVISELWAQQFNMYGHHDEHIHSGGSQISGFYFLEVPKNSSRVIFHDPNHSKRQISLLERDDRVITPASIALNHEVKPGELFLFNSWLPHSFVPNASSLPFKFIHFNVITIPAHNHHVCQPAAEVI
jgi:uncharacterized protein (TIGR02466 family)